MSTESLYRSTTRRHKSDARFEGNNVNDKRVNVAMIGLGFGAEFIPIYKDHENANVYALCRRNERELHKVADQFEIEKRDTNYDDVLAGPPPRAAPWAVLVPQFSRNCGCHWLCQCLPIHSLAVPHWRSQWHTTAKIK